MSHSFTVTIDESGDDGFTFADRNSGESRKSSRWLVISAAVFLTQNERKNVQVIDRVARLINAKTGKVLHFTKLTHEKKLVYVKNLATVNFKAASVLIHKPDLNDGKAFAEKYRLYFYATRFLLERVSWLCRDRFRSTTKPKIQGDGSAHIIFSNRRKMSYDDLKDYFIRLKSLPRSDDVRIDWDVIKDSQIETAVAGDFHGKHARGLQIADALASGISRAVDPCPMWTTEDRYAKELQPLFYTRNGCAWGYGIKVFPKQAAEMMGSNLPTWAR